MADIFPGATLIQLSEWGYPMGQLRPTPDPALAYSVIHITANLASAENEAAWRLNDPALQNSATFFLNQDGSAVQCLDDPLHMDPWTNGDVNRPDLSNPRISHMQSSGVNANERSLVTIENVGREPGTPISPAQEAKCAQIIAYYHAKAGVPVNRQTVIGHYQINSVDRPNCPGVNKSVIDRIVALASGGDVNLKGTPVQPLTESSRRMQTSIIEPGGVGVVRDPTVQGQPYDLLPVGLAVGKSVTVDWVVTGNDWHGGNKWYGAWMWTSPPEFGYIPAGACGPLVASTAPDSPTAKEAADAVAAAAADKAAEF